MMSLADELASKSVKDAKQLYPEDTVSDEEYFSSSGESDEESKKDSKASSNVSHSRFSSNLGEIQAEIE